MRRHSDLSAIFRSNPAGVLAPPTNFGRLYKNLSLVFLFPSFLPLFWSSTSFPSVPASSRVQELSFASSYNPSSVLSSFLLAPTLIHSSLSPTTISSSFFSTATRQPIPVSPLISCWWSTPHIHRVELAWVNKIAVIGCTWLIVYESALIYEGRMNAAPGWFGVPEEKPDVWLLNWS